MEIKKHLMEGLFCVGCGSKIQIDDFKKLGYIPISALKNGFENDNVLCQRCFRLRHYNKNSVVDLKDADFRNLLSNISAMNVLVVYVIDVFNFNGSLIPGLHRFVGNNPVLLVGNKIDVLPHSLQRNKIKKWLRQQANISGIRPVDIVLTSGKSGEDISVLLSMIEKYRMGCSVYIVGVTNVGKSTLINQIIKCVTGNKNEVITISRFPGTTLDRIEIPLDNKTNIVDTPGIINHNQITSCLTAEDLRYTLPQKELKPRTYQLDAEQVLFIGAMARFEYIQGAKAGIVTYFENNLPIHRTKLSKADKFYKKHAGELLTPPKKENLLTLKRHEFKITEKTDIVVSGLGWITVSSKSVITMWAPKDISVLIRKAMI